MGKTLKVLPPVSSPLQQVPSPNTPAALAQHRKKPTGSHKVAQHTALVVGRYSLWLVFDGRSDDHNFTILVCSKESGLPKPAYSYSCLIALALKNSPNGSMSVSEIYKFMW